MERLTVPRALVRLSLVAAIYALLVPGIAKGAHAQAASVSSGPVAEGGGSLLEAPLLVTGVEAITGAGQAAAEREARLSTPEAVEEREASRTRFEGLNRAAAVAVAEGAFGIEQPAWSPPESNDEGHITKYISENLASEVASTGQHLMLYGERRRSRIRRRGTPTARPCSRRSLRSRPAVGSSRRWRRRNGIHHRNY
jgi:hypothetical protein